MTAPTELPPFLQDIEPERTRAPIMPGQHGGPSELYRMATLDALTAARDHVDALIDAVRAIPDDDDVADELIRRFWQAQDRAGGTLVMFRNSRDTQGQA